MEPSGIGGRPVGGNAAEEGQKAPLLRRHLLRSLKNSLDDLHLKDEIN
jgi:hypothetical protein